MECKWRLKNPSQNYEIMSRPERLTEQEQAECKPQIVHNRPIDNSCNPFPILTLFACSF